ncbi:GIY-YIG nuclease family protein [Patescibacteria group bacterium]
MWFTYIIKSINKNWYYVGSTNRLKERINEHNEGKVTSTKPYRLFTLIYKRF